MGGFFITQNPYIRFLLNCPPQIDHYGIAYPGNALFFASPKINQTDLSVL
jgi:hypothetical protein